MNRKFASGVTKDPDAPAVDAIKSIIKDEQVSLVINLHDGHGFYRETYKNTIFNPNAWGQTCVIDQSCLDANQTFGNLDKIAKSVSRHLNRDLLRQHHAFNVRNTKTKFDDEAMQLSLTYFAVTHNKPAFALETSKSLTSLSHKVFYQLRAIEAFMNIMEIDYERPFELTEENVEKLIHEYGKIVINNKISLDLKDIRKSLSFIPLESTKNTFVFSHPLGSVKQAGNTYVLYIGNRVVTRFRPETFTSKKCSDDIAFDIDGNEQIVPIASETFVDADFQVKADENLRVNIIGFTDPDDVSENRRVVSMVDLNSRFSIDKAKRCYRVELYDDDSFCGMVVVHFK